MFGITPYNKYHGVYDPFRELEKMEKELFSGRDGLASFRTDIKDNGDAYLLEAELPGFKKEDIHVDIANGVLTVSAERKHDEEGQYRPLRAHLRQVRAQLRRKRDQRKGYLGRVCRRRSQTQSPEKDRGRSRVKTA